MTVITVRRVSDNALVCFGPNDGAYDPTVSSGCVKAVEPDYAAVFLEWTNRPPMTSAEKDTELQAFLDSAGGKVAKAIATVLVQKNICTLADLKAAYRAL